METIKRKSKMGELLTIMLKTRLEKIVKKVMTAIIVFGMVISPAVNAMADGEDGDVPPPPPVVGKVAVVADHHHQLMQIFQHHHNYMKNNKMLLTKLHHH
ncbi:hypothetical protein AGMMS49950_07330 [Endomicrobiia bacterium]|nr:hypothetical protein AGMMS49950_07330 [Endomicrobiia bacterium]